MPITATYLYNIQVNILFLYFCSWVIHISFTSCLCLSLPGLNLSILFFICLALHCLFPSTLFLSHPLSLSFCIIFNFHEIFFQYELWVTWHFLQLVEFYFDHVKLFSPLFLSYVSHPPLNPLLTVWTKSQSSLPIIKGSLTLTLTVSKPDGLGWWGWWGVLSQTQRLQDWIIFRINTPCDNWLIPASVCLMSAA